MPGPRCLSSRPLRIVCPLLFFVLLLLLQHATASDEPFTGPANWGGTGLMEVPTARVMKEDTYRFGAGQVYPYRYYYGAISPLKGLEVEGHVTEIIGVKSGLADYGNDKDKAMSIKYQFLPETKYLPALAIDIMDPTGTRLYASQSIIASKQIYPFDFTVGFGNGRFGSQPLPPQSQGFKVEMFTDTNQWLKDSRAFWGIQFAPSPKYSLMMEYNPIKYEIQTRDPAQPKYFSNPVASQFNFGVRWKPFTWAELDLTYQRGNEIGLNASVAFEIGNPLIPIYYKPYKEKPAGRQNPLNERIATALTSLGFGNIGVVESGDELWIEAENDKYFYNTKAVGILLATVNEITPPSVKKYRVIITQNELPLFEYQVLRQDLLDLYAGRMTTNEFFYLSSIRTDVTETFDASIRNKRLFQYGWKPALETFLNDPSGVFQYRLGAEVYGTFNPWKGGSFIAGINAFPLNNISTTNQPLSIPTRSDIVPYLQQDFNLGRLMFEQKGKPANNLYWRLSGGYLEFEYAGLDGEVATPLKDGRLMVSVSGSLVKKREPGNTFAMLNPNSVNYYVKNYYYTGFVNARLNLPGPEISLDVKAGRFLAGDTGVLVTASKNIKGVNLFAWYSWTDTSVFSDSFNRGYHNQGIGITIPMRLFEGTDSKTVFDYAVAPWTRDVAQDISHYDTLFNFMGRNTKVFLDKDSKLLH
jgi:hypothetical protein